MKRGEDWALNARDKGPERKLVRDFVDSKRRISEFYMYALIVLLLALFTRNKTISAYVSPFVIVLIVLVFVDGFVLSRGLHRLMDERFPGPRPRGFYWAGMGNRSPYGQKGLSLYALIRALQIRRFRVPAPQVKPGDTI